MNVVYLMDNPFFEIILHDIYFPFYEDVDVIYNLVYSVSPIYCSKKLVHTTKVSVHGSIDMLELAKIKTFAERSNLDGCRKDI